jgi:hypothetical protein
MRWSRKVVLQKECVGFLGIDLFQGSHCKAIASVAIARLRRAMTPP